MTNGTTHLTIHTFRRGTPKESAMKVLEEASEAREAWQQCERWMPEVATDSDAARAEGIRMAYLAEELADCVTACCNLAARYRIDLQDAILRVEDRNRRRGRYA